VDGIVCGYTELLRVNVLPQLKFATAEFTKVKLPVTVNDAPELNVKSPKSFNVKLLIVTEPVFSIHGFGFEKLMSMLSVGVGTTDGIQFDAVYQSVLVAPVQYLIGALPVISPASRESDV